MIIVDALYCGGSGALALVVGLTVFKVHHDCKVKYIIALELAAMFLISGLSAAFSIHLLHEGPTGNVKLLQCVALYCTMKAVTVPFELPLSNRPRHGSHLDGRRRVAPHAPRPAMEEPLLPHGLVVFCRPGSE